MISSVEFLASEQASKFPDWIKQHPDWRHYRTIDKIFPSLGLTNCREPYPTAITDYGESDTGSPKKMDIVFSSDGIEGMWDIATMSMRGALSCRHWDNPHASKSYDLLRDMTNPNFGIIYFTDGSMTPYGLSMNKRALVRYEPGRMAPVFPACIYIDRIYTKTTNRDPMKYVNTDPFNGEIKEILKKFIRSKLNNKAKANTTIR